MSNVANELDPDSLQNKQRPPYVKFFRRPVENRDMTIKEGRAVMVDVDMVSITPIGTRDVIEKTIPDWKEGLKQQVDNHRISPVWVAQYDAAYAAWKSGQEVPVAGTPIRGWTLISPAQQENVIHANIRTVEDLAQCNEESLGRIGMGALELKRKAETWIKAQTGPGKLAQENVALKAEISAQGVRIDTLTKQVTELLEKTKEK